MITKRVSEGQTVNQTFYLKVLATLQGRFCKKLQALWKNQLWILHQDFATVYNVLSMKRYLAARSTPVLKDTPYSPDLAPCDFFIFPKIKPDLKGIQFEWMEEMKRKSTEFLNALTKEDFQHCFDQGKKPNGLCAVREREYIGWACDCEIKLFHKLSHLIASPRIWGRSKLCSF